MPGWEPTKPATLIPHQTEQVRYDQIVAEVADLLYSYFYQLHRQTILHKPHQVEAPDQGHEKVQGRFHQS